MSALILQSAVSLAEGIRAGSLSAREVVEAHIERMHAINPRLNAVVEAREARARQEALAADRALEERGPDRVGPLHGVPCTIKESFEVEGMPHTAGLVARKGVRATRDATAVRRLREAGAIPIGVTNVSELLMWVESDNRVYGRCNNAYDPDRIAGGSSGGEGASVGAGIAPFGLGADIGGSIRLPAFFNGVFGHKPSARLVPNTGQWPIAENDALLMLGTGPLARRAEDLWPLLRVLAGPDGECAVCAPLALGDPDRVELASVRVFDVSDAPLPVQESLRSAQRRAAAHLAARGAVVREAHYPELGRAAWIWSASLSEHNDTPFRVLLGHGEAKPIGRELVRWALGRSEHTLPALALAAIEPIPERFPGASAKLLREGERVRDAWNELLGDDGVMLLPSYRRLAPRHRQPLLRPFDHGYTAIVNVTGLASTQVPLGLDPEGLPLGVQVVAAQGRDHLCVAVARELERAFGGWVPPSLA